MSGKNRLFLRIIFILSLSFNAAFLIQLLSPARAHSEAVGEPAALNLSDRQKQRIGPVRMELHKENEAIKQQIVRHQQELLAVLKKEPIDRAEANRCIDKINGLQKKIQQNTVEEIIRIRQYMTDHQCNCLIDGIGAAMQQKSQPCNGDCCRKN
jgi:Spy/CpxP family protein refolding chaperone